MAGRLQDKICIITGAGSGMGRAMARLFHTEGAKLLLADISGKEDEVAADLGGEVVSIHCDVSSEAQVKTMIQHGTLILSADQAGVIQIRDFAAGFSQVCPDVSLTTQELQAGNVMNFQ